MVMDNETAAANALSAEERSEAVSVIVDCGLDPSHRFKWLDVAHVTGRVEIISVRDACWIPMASHVTATVAGVTVFVHVEAVAGRCIEAVDATIDPQALTFRL